MANYNKNHVYLGNPRLKAAGVSMSFTQAQLDEFTKCKLDPIYFIETYIKIVNVDDGVIPFKLYKYQKKLVNLIHSNRKVLTTQSRQSGKTTLFAAYICHYIIFNDHKTVAILANKADVAREILSRVQFAYELLPKWIQQGVVEWNKGSLEIENGSQIIASSTSSGAIRGFSVNFLYLDEFAFVPFNLADEFFKSVYPTISSGKTTKITISSTPNGLNHFWKLFTQAENKINDFKFMKVTWHEVPGRDNKWAEAERKALGDVAFTQEHECEFLGGTNTLIDGKKLKQIPFIRPIVETEYMCSYERPVKDKVYVISVDVSRGKHLDYSAFCVIDITELPYRIVAKYKDNSISTMVYPNVIFKMAKEYNDAMVLIETNDAGKQVADIVYSELEYENTLMSDSKGMVSMWGKNLDVGLTTTKKTKRIGCQLLKSIVENDKFIINDSDVIFELSNFVANKKGSFEADEGYNDDLAMCCVNFAYLTTQPVFKELHDVDLRKRLFEDKIKQIEDEMTPFGFIVDGTEEDVYAADF